MYKFKEEIFKRKIEIAKEKLIARTRQQLGKFKEKVKDEV